jgi:hypothetical protein
MAERTTPEPSALAWLAQAREALSEASLLLNAATTHAVQPHGPRRTEHHTAAETGLREAELRLERAASRLSQASAAGARELAFDLAVSLVVHRLRVGVVTAIQTARGVRRLVAMESRVSGPLSWAGKAAERLHNDVFLMGVTLDGVCWTVSEPGAAPAPRPEPVVEPVASSPVTAAGVRLAKCTCGHGQERHRIAVGALDPCKDCRCQFFLSEVEHG